MTFKRNRVIFQNCFLCLCSLLSVWCTYLASKRLCSTVYFGLASTILMQLLVTKLRKFVLDVKTDNATHTPRECGESYFSHNEALWGEKREALSRFEKGLTQQRGDWVGCHRVLPAEWVGRGRWGLPVWNFLVPAFISMCLNLEQKWKREGWWLKSYWPSNIKKWW